MKNKKEYKFVRIPIKGIFRPKLEEDYHDIIDEHAKRGWRFVQVFAPSITGKGYALFYELIFERDVKEEEK